MLEHTDIACHARAGDSARQCSAEPPDPGGACNQCHASLCSSPLVQLLAGQGEWERALAVYRAMTLASVRPDSTTAGLLVAACTKGGNQQLATQLAAVSWGWAVRGTERWVGRGVVGGTVCTWLLQSGGLPVAHSVLRQRFHPCRCPNKPFLRLTAAALDPIASHRTLRGRACWRSRCRRRRPPPMTAGRFGRCRCQCQWQLAQTVARRSPAMAAAPMAQAAAPTTPAAVPAPAQAAAAAVLVC